MLAGETRPSPLSDRDCLRIATEAYNRHHASQKIDELTQALIRVSALVPETILEIGCDAGGTLYCWSRLAAQVVGVTLAHNTLETGGQGVGYRLDPHGATVIIGDSHQTATLAAVMDVMATVDVLHIDGDHSYQGVRSDFEMYGPLVRPGGLVLFHDAANHHDPRVDVPRFFSELEGEKELIVGSGRPLGFGIWTKETKA